LQKKQEVATQYHKGDGIRRFQPIIAAVIRKCRRGKFWNENKVSQDSNTKKHKEKK
jgi:hypothetical protein